jgi:hypothetical protein
MTSPYQYERLETLQLENDYSDRDWRVWVPNPEINGQAKLEFGTRWATGIPMDPPRFRLLQLMNGCHDSEPVRIRLTIYGLLQAPVYEALSYVWGNPETVYEIECDGMSMMVNENVYKALRQLRYRDIPRTLWIDALCINQRDKDERSSQVGLMGEIYARAQHVLIWLGEKSSLDEHAFEAFKAIYCLVTQQRELDPSRKPTLEEINSLPYFPTTGWNQIRSFFKRPWFTRLWVLQEVIKAPHAIFLLENRCLPYDTLEEIIPCLLRLEVEDLIGTDKFIVQLLVRSCRKMARGGNNQLTIFDLMAGTNHLETSEPRDRLYALLGLPLVEMEWVPLPNYDLTPMEVFRDFAVLDVVYNRSLRAVSWASLSEPEELPNPDFPSWTPNITKRTNPVISFASYMQNLTAGGKLGIEAEVHEKTILKLRGRKIGEVSKNREQQKRALCPSISASS